MEMESYIPYLAAISSGPIPVSRTSISCDKFQNVSHFFLPSFPHSLTLSTTLAVPFKLLLYILKDITITVP
jgi:hypothetical protein